MFYLLLINLCIIIYLKNKLILSITNFICNFIKFIEYKTFIISTNASYRFNSFFKMLYFIPVIVFLLTINGTVFKFCKYFYTF
jgi:hypothetical protein